LRDHADGPFLHVPGATPRYQTRGGDVVPLSPLSLPSFATQGEATNATPIDSGDARTTWHRAYVEACIPPGCGLRLWLAATNDLAPPDSDAEWHEHRFGDRFKSPAPGDDAWTIPPRAAWLPAVCELPMHGGLLQCPPVRDRVGLFTVLVQRSRRATRALRGRFLWARLQLVGNGLSTPDVAAVRAYASRFSYLEQYLPELYHETLFGADADRVLKSDEQATPSDFLERFLATFEGVLTPLEDTIASACLLTDPRSAPAEALEWLASWIGLGFEPGYPLAQRRALIAAAPTLYKKHGTLAGMSLALDVATDGACSRGSIVVVEDFRLRRTALTILGANLADADDPLLAGLSVSGNSFVGDTLILGDEHRDEFLALFGPDISITPHERSAVAAFFDRLAHRVTVLVHRDTPSEELALIRRIVELETPAHVESRIGTASDAFLVGVAALVAVDTSPGPEMRPASVEVDRSYLGWRDLVLGMPSLDPRLESGGTVPQPGSWNRPVADSHGVTTPFGAPFTLDASASHAASGRSIVNYSWSLTGPA
jgi:phage tail-like protein